MIIAMFPESKVTEIYCMGDDFTGDFCRNREKDMNED